MSTVQLLLERNAGRVTDVDTHGNTALHGAVLRAGSIPLVKLLVSKMRVSVKASPGLNRSRPLGPPAVLFLSTANTANITANIKRSVIR